MRISDWSSDVCSSDLANKPKDSFLLVDEAYIHWYDGPNAAKLVAGRKDLIVMRTFSKLFGMAGVRLGLTFADPEVQKRISLFGPTAGGLSITAMACGNAVYPEARSEEHTSELQSLMRISYAVFCLKKKNKTQKNQNT